MRFDLTRLRRGEWLAAISAVALAVVVFALKWYRPDGAPKALNGWHATTHLRWLLLLTILTALALLGLQATLTAPAIPVSTSVILAVLAILALLWLAYRVFINAPPHQQAGAFLGVVATLGIACGAYLSMREEGGAAGGARIPLVSLGQEDRS